MKTELLLDDNGLLTIRTFLHLRGISRCLIYGDGICNEDYTYDLLPHNVENVTAAITHQNTGNTTTKNFVKVNSARRWLTRKYYEINKI